MSHCNRGRGERGGGLACLEEKRAGMSLKFQITSVLPTLTLYDNILLALQAQSSLFDLVFSRTRGLYFIDAVFDLAEKLRSRSAHRTNSSNAPGFQYFSQYS